MSFPLFPSTVKNVFPYSSLKITSAVWRRIVAIQERLIFFCKVWNFQLFFVIYLKITTHKACSCATSLGRQHSLYASIHNQMNHLESDLKNPTCAEIHTTYMMIYADSCIMISVIILNPPFYFQRLVIWTTFTVRIDDPGKCSCIYVDEVGTYNWKSVPQKRQTYIDFSLRVYSNRILSVECLFYLHNVPEISRYSPISMGKKAVTYETRFACHQHLTHELEFFLRPANSSFR